MTQDEVFEVCDRIREASFGLHRFLRAGHMEKVYENGLANRLRKAGLKVEAQCPIEVHDEDGSLLGEYYADLVVEDVLLLEIKACRAIAEEHIAQLLGYLRGCQMRHGLLINFGAPKLEIRKYVMDSHCATEA